LWKKILHLPFGDVTPCGLVLGIKVSANSDAAIFFMVDLVVEEKRYSETLITICETAMRNIAVVQNLLYICDLTTQHYGKPNRQ